MCPLRCGVPARLSLCWAPALPTPAAFWVPPRDIDGELPQGLDGSYFRIGPSPVDPKEKWDKGTGMRGGLVPRPAAVPAARLRDSGCEG
eukprot:gene17174-14950_t